MLRKLRNVLWIFVVGFSVLILSLISASPGLTDNLVTYYKLDETSGTNVEDIHGTNNGTANDARVFTTEATGIINTGADFTGGDDYINTNFNIYDVIDFDGNWSWNFWIKGSDDGVFMGARSGSAPNANLRFEMSDGVFHLRTYGFSIGFVTGTTLINDSEWHQLTFTQSTVDGVKLYVDANEDASSETILEDIDIGYDWYLGTANRDDTDLWAPINATADEFGLWNKTLSSDGVSDLYNSGNSWAYPFVEDTCSCPGLNENWEIDMSDYCNITSDCDLGTGKLSFTGSGEIRINSTIDTSDLGDPGANGILFIQDSCTIWVN